MNRWGKQKNDPADKITPERWKKHFEKLLNVGQILSSQLEKHKEFHPELDGIITQKELQDAIANMKCKKAPGHDGILTEYIKIFAQIAEPIILKLVRLIFANHIYPSEWNLNFLKPIYKKGDTDNTNNFRGLAIAPALAKVYGQIMLKRLTDYIVKRKFISPNQIGFMKGCRTSDHIFLLQTVIEKIVKKHMRRLFCAFVDLKRLMIQ